MAEAGRTSDDETLIADARTMVSAWTRRRLRQMAIVELTLLTICLGGGIAGWRTSQWQSELLRTGARATGTVTAVSSYVSEQDGQREAVSIAVAPEPTFDLVVRTPPGAYAVGDRLTVYYDPHDLAHARTDRYHTADDWWTSLAIFVAAVTGGAAAGLSIVFVYVALVGHLGRRLHVARVDDTTRVSAGRSHRELVRFVDTGDVVWSSVKGPLPGQLKRHARVVVGGRRWRVVYVTGGTRPLVCRPLRSGARLWALGRRR